MEGTGAQAEGQHARRWRDVLTGGSTSRKLFSVKSLQKKHTDAKLAGGISARGGISVVLNLVVIPAFLSYKLQPG